MRSISVVAASALAVCGMLLLGTPPAARAQATPAVGSRNVALADPAIPRPGTAPCVVTLISNQSFGQHGDGARMDAAPHDFRYQPPTGCKGAWAKVVLEADFSVDAGEQYDRTASIWLDGVNLYLGTTQEPSAGVAPHWQVQRDLTDYSRLLRRPGHGQILINNWLDAVRASVIHVSARLLFYPASAAFPAPVVPSRIIALNPAGQLPAKLAGSDAKLARDILFPRNTARVYLDLFAQPQAHDEFYYMCLPDAVIAKAGHPGSNGSIDRSQVCGGGSFREARVSIDGKPAGLAPIAPWIFTGGLDPFLWQPTPAAQTLNLLPYRVDLTPFAGVLADGKPHAIEVQVIDTPNFFSIAGALLVYQDRRTAHTGGAVTRNTLATATIQPSVTSTLVRDARGVHGDVLTRARQHYVIEGYVDTPDGRVQSRVDTTLGFANTQQFTPGASQGRRHLVRQTARLVSSSSRSGGGVRAQSLQKTIDYTLDVHTTVRARGSLRHRDVQLLQRFSRHLLQREAGLPLYQASVSNTHLGSDRLGYIQGDRKSFASRGQTSRQDFRFTDSLGDCYQAQVQAQAGAVTSVSHGQGCLQPHSMHWFVHPDGSPDNFGWRGTLNPSSQPAPHP